MIDLPLLMTDLARVRPLFHSEADFQLALAWAWQRRNPAAAIRLEYRLPLELERGYADLWVREADETSYGELKYWTHKLEVDVGDERFALADQAAQDLSRYDFIRDLARVERVVATGRAARGFVLALTNDQGFWNAPRRGTIDEAFRLHEGRVLSGSLAWDRRASAGTTTGRTGVLDLRGWYACTWRNYSDVGGAGRGEFRYLLLPVTRETSSPDDFAPAS